MLDLLYGERSGDVRLAGAGVADSTEGGPAAQSGGSSDGVVAGMDAGTSVGPENRR